MCIHGLMCYCMAGGGFRSISDYGSGRFGIRMKLPDANTTGIIISFYVCFFFFFFYLFVLAIVALIILVITIH